MNVLAPFAFLTRVVPGGGTLEEVGEAAFLFPVVGAFIGLLVASASWLLLVLFPPPVAAALALAALYATTGLLHLDGLADFADGLAMGGVPMTRRQAMNTGTIGAAGLLAAFLTLLLAWGALAELFGSATFGMGSPLPAVFAILVTSEVGAKLAMNFAMGMGRPVGEGMASAVISRVRRHHLLYGTGLALALTFAVSPRLAPIVLAAAWVPAAIIVRLADRSIGGVTGDVLGAVNEVGRVAGLLAMTVILRTL